MLAKAPIHKMDTIELKEKYRSFGISDYVIFAVMLLVSTLIGIYFAFKKSKHTDAAVEYLTGGRKMPVFALTMSLIASWASGITCLGNTTEIYFYGTKYMFISLGFIPAGIVSAYVFLPVFHEMGISSTFEYLERRFSKKVRLFGAIAFSIEMLGFLPITIYVVALAFNQVTGINLHITSICACAVCIFYTTIGGMKAVVWTDVIQTLIMIGAMVMVVAKGVIEIGGFNVVWGRAQEGGRLEEPSFQLDFTDRHSIWSLTIGAGLNFLQEAYLAQNMAQRYLSLSTIKDLRKTVLFFTIGIICFHATACLPGLVIYASYYDCDPLTTQLAKAKDQLLPLFVTQVLGDFPGLPGLFIAGAFSASLSSLSTGLNSMSGVVLQDFVQILRPNQTLSNRWKKIIMKSVPVIFGTSCIGLIFIVEKLGTIVQLATSVTSATSGPCLGIVCGGMLLPWMNSKGAFYGGLLGIAVSGFVIVGTQNAVLMGQIQYPTKSLSVDGCDYLYNSTVTNVTFTASDVFPLYKMSYLWYTLFGSISTLILAMTISFFTGCNDPSSINPSYLSPVIRRYLPRRKEVQEELSPCL